MVVPMVDVMHVAMLVRGYAAGCSSRAIPFGDHVRH
jgi:hypothetical protein